MEKKCGEWRGDEQRRSKGKLSSVRPSVLIQSHVNLVAAGPQNQTRCLGSFTQMLPHALLLNLFLFLPLVISDDARPHELTIHRDIHTRRCTIVRARRIPRYRRLGGEHHAFGFSRILFIGDRDRAVEQVTVSATDTTSLQDHFSQICPDFDNTLAEVLPTVATGASQQHAFTVLANAGEDLGPPEGVILLEVTEIMVSGPSSNRVDVTLFSDGCECLVPTWVVPYPASQPSSPTDPLSHLPAASSHPFRSCLLVCSIYL